MVSEEKKILGVSIGVIMLIAGLILLFGSFRIIDAGERGVVLRLGQVDRVMDAGLNMKIPMIESVVKYQVRTVKYSADASAASKDLQDAQTSVAVNYHIDPARVAEIYTTLGRSYEDTFIAPAIQDRSYEDTFIAPAIQEVVKATTAQYRAEELITQRALVKDNIESALRARLDPRGLYLESVSITNFAFSEQFNSAIEATATSQQLSLKAANDLERIQIEADQRIAQARGEAEAIRIQAQAIQSQGGADYVKLKAIEKWSGTLPQYVMGNTIPFIQIPTG